MGKVLLDMSISVDGFIAGPDNTDAGLHNWYFSPAPASAAVIDELVTSIGAIIMGRNTYDLGAAADGFADNPYQAAHFVLTNHPPEKPARGAENFVFVTDGLESAVKQAQNAAKDRIITIGGGASIARQALKAELIDEIQLHIIPKLLGRGLRLFENDDAQEVNLEVMRVVTSVGVNHIRYRVAK